MKYNMILNIYGQGHKQNGPKSNKVIFASVLPKMKEIWKVVWMLMRELKSAAGRHM